MPAERLHDVLGVASVRYVPGRGRLAVVDATLSGAPPTTPSGVTPERDTARRAPALRPNEIAIDNFTFAPRALTVKPGTEVAWVNRDDVPHQVVAVHGRFASSPVLDTAQRYAVRLRAPGTYTYYCSLHPQMTGRITVG